MEDGLLMKRVQTESGEQKGLIAIPKDLRGSTILSLAHTHKTAGHFGKAKTAERAIQHFYWPHLGKDAANSVQTVNVETEESHQ